MRRAYERQHLADTYWARLRDGGDADPRARLLEAMSAYNRAPDLQSAACLGAVLLRYFLADNNMTLREFGLIVGLVKFDQVLKRWTKEGVTPELSVAMAIDAVTMGVVPAESWLIGGPAFARESRFSNLRAHRVRLVKASYLVKVQHLPSRKLLLTKLREWVKLELPADLAHFKCPTYKRLGDWGRVKGLITPESTRFETTNEPPDFRFLCDAEGRPIPPEGYERQLEAASSRLAEERRARAESYLARRAAAVARENAEAEALSRRNILPRPGR